MDDATTALSIIRKRLEAACRKAGRDAATVTLVGASKSVPETVLEHFAAAGLHDLGENYLREALAKMAALGPQVRWHFIGALQSNKAADAVRHFDLIHSVDRPSVAMALDKAAAAQQKKQRVLLQVNLGNEASKAGCRPEDAMEMVRLCGRLRHVELQGLMCLPPYHDDPEMSRPFFRQLKQLLMETQLLIPPARQLSMGMSRDFEVAIEEGATMVRVGSALFGPRR